MSEKEQEKKSHWERFTDLHKEVMTKDAEDGKTVSSLRYYKPFYMYMIAGELAVMNDNLKRIAEALEVQNDREKRN